MLNELALENMSQAQFSRERTASEGCKLTYSPSIDYTDLLEDISEEGESLHDRVNEGHDIGK